MSRPPTHEDLVLHALGRLAPRRREEIADAIARDPVLARESADVARHLDLYDQLPAPPAPPPFETLRARLGAQRAQRRDPLRLFKLGVVATVIVGCGVALLGQTGMQQDVAQGPGLREVGGVRVDHGRFRPAGDEPGELRVDDRVRVVLDRDAELVRGDPPFLRGRAWFEVGPGPFSVATEHGVVEVRGTAFEVDARRGLLVRVVEGRVRALGREAGPGETISTGDAVAQGLPGAFARRPRLEVTMTPAADGTGGFDVRLVFSAPQHVSVDLPGPSTGASAAWLALTPPEGADVTMGLDLASVGVGLPQPGRSKRLGRGERYELRFLVPRPPGPPGIWRLAALYRPEGEAALASEPIPLEVR